MFQAGWTLRSEWNQLALGKWTCISVAPFQSAFKHLSHTHTHTHTHTAAMQGPDLLIRGNLGFSILLKDTSNMQIQIQHDTESNLLPPDC